MSALRRLLATGLIVLVGLLAPAGAWGQTFTSDDTGRPAPWDSYIDDSVTPPVSVPVSTSHPLPTGTGAASISTDIFGYGRQYLFALTGLQGGGQPAPAPAITLFTDAVNVVGLRSSGAAPSLYAYASSDGGRTWGPGVSTGFPVAGVTNNPFQLIRTVSPSPRFVVNATGQAGFSVWNSLNIGSGWATSTGIPAGNRRYGLGAQGSAVLAVGPNAGATATVGCISADNGQTFPTCVTIDAAAGSLPSGTAAPVVATPSSNIWLTLLADGKIWRSANNGATWTNVQTVPAEGPIFCVSSTVCIAASNGAVWKSIDAGATWATTLTLPTPNSDFTICPYNATTFDVLFLSTYPATATDVQVLAYRTTDAGTSFIGTPITGGIATFGLGNIALSGPCSTTVGGRASFVVSKSGSLGVYYGTTMQNAVQIVGGNGIPVAVDANGNLTANQGVAAASPGAWPITPVQGTTPFNSNATGAANTAVTATITALAGARGHVYTISGFCSAGTATFTVQDGVTTIWTAPAGFVTTTLTSLSWTPAGLTGTTGNAMTVTLSTCGGGNTGTLNVEADRS